MDMVLSTNVSLKIAKLLPKLLRLLKPIKGSLDNADKRRVRVVQEDNDKHDDDIKSTLAQILHRIDKLVKNLRLESRTP